MERLGGLYNSKLTPLKELKFVPATKDDKVPIPEGINLIVLNGGDSKVSSGPCPVFCVPPEKVHIRGIRSESVDHCTALD